MQDNDLAVPEDVTKEYAEKQVEGDVAECDICFAFISRSRVNDHRYWHQTTGTLLYRFGREQQFGRDIHGTP